MRWGCERIPCIPMPYAYRCELLTVFNCRYCYSEGHCVEKVGQSSIGCKACYYVGVPFANPEHVNPKSGN